MTRRLNGMVVSVYIPHDLYDAVKAQGWNLSRITQLAVRRKLKELTNAKDPTEDRG